MDGRREVDPLDSQRLERRAHAQLALAERRDERAGPLHVFNDEFPVPANALRDPVSGEIGKSIVFCVSQNHAMKITEILNKMADILAKYLKRLAAPLLTS